MVVTSEALNFVDIDQRRYHYATPPTPAHQSAHEI